MRKDGSKMKLLKTLILISSVFLLITPGFSEVTGFGNNPQRTGESPYISPTEPIELWNFHPGSFITSTPAIVKEVADAITFIATADYMNGETMVLDGGCSQINWPKIL